MTRHQRYNRSEKGRARYLRYWHKADGGYMRRRKRELAAQRETVTRRLADLEVEAEAFLADIGWHP